MENKKEYNKELLITSEKVREILAYDMNTGEFRWKSRMSNRVKKNDVAGCIIPSGYRVIGIRINDETYEFRAHRLAWLYVYGAWPSKSLDHIDRNKLNNRIVNLREATGTENNQNRKKNANAAYKYIGVHRCNRNGKWRARITVRGKLYTVGYFETEEQAALAYNKAAIERDKNFLNLNCL